MKILKPILVIFSITLFISCSGNMAGAYTWVQWDATSGGNDHWYAFTESATSWTSAKSEAETAGGTLAIINTASENAWLETNFSGFHWIGLYLPAGSSANNKTDWRWVDETTPTFDGWASGQPDWDDAYGALSSGSQYVAGWHNVPDTGWTDGRGIIEVNSVPLPGAFWLLGVGLFGLAAVRQREKS